MCLNRTPESCPFPLTPGCFFTKPRLLKNKRRWRSILTPSLRSPCHESPFPYLKLWRLASIQYVC